MRNQHSRRSDVPIHVFILKRSRENAHLQEKESQLWFEQIEQRENKKAQKMFLLSEVPEGISMLNESDVPICIVIFARKLLRQTDLNKKKKRHAYLRYFAKRLKKFQQIRVSTRERKVSQKEARCLQYCFSY